MTLADAIQQQTAANEEKLAAGIRAPMQLDANAAILLKPFDSFCAQHGCRNFPASPRLVAAFIQAAEKLSADSETIVNVLWAIELLHDAHGLANPVATAVVREELSKILDLYGEPRSWPKAEQLLFSTLPAEIRAIVAKRERERDRELRRCQNAAAEAKRHSGSADKPAIKPNEETKDDNQKTQ